MRLQRSSISEGATSSIFRLFVHAFDVLVFIVSAVLRLRNGVLMFMSACVRTYACVRVRTQRGFLEFIFLKREQALRTFKLFGFGDNGGVEKCSGCTGHGWFLYRGKILL